MERVDLIGLRLVPELAEENWAAQLFGAFLPGLDLEAETDEAGAKLRERGIARRTQFQGTNRGLGYREHADDLLDPRGWTRTRGVVLPEWKCRSHAKPQPTSVLG